MRPLLLLALFALGCRNEEQIPDLDGDGSIAGVDCDDEDPTVFPGADEVCDGLDNDCDGDADGGALDAQTWYGDADRDGFGGAGATTSCQQPPDTADRGGDCDDTQASAYPGADEVCDGLDNDCDGLVDDAAQDAPTWYADADSDGFGGPLSEVACEAPARHVASGGDCDDSDNSVFPGAPEEDCADPTDYNCDGSTGYADADADGYPACDDCDDSAASANPGGAEVCDDLDNDCDGSADHDALDAPTWYADADADGFGDAASATRACSLPAHYVADREDCDDARADVSPAATEVCDALDNDCDGSTDEEAADALTWYADADADGFAGAAVAAVACEGPPGTATVPLDCDDLHADSYPGAAERCDGRLNDCGGALAPDEADGDADGVRGCEGDCDDARADVRPGQPEVCDALDNDCDGGTDESALDAPTWYADADADGYGDAVSALRACESPAQHVADDLDCDDARADVSPAATEVCDGLDNDCDGTVDLDAPTKPTWYLDLDGDGAGTVGVSLDACVAPAHFVGNSRDCDDASALRHPDLAEICDHLDNDCDLSVDEDDATGAPLWFLDADGDGQGDAAAAARHCWAEPHEVSSDEDCDDARANVFTGAEEVWYDGLIQDCDVDSDLDQDGDGVDSIYYGGEDCDDLDAGWSDLCLHGTGGDGDYLVSTQGEVINYLAALDASASAGSTEIFLNPEDAYAVGDELMLHQTQGAGAGTYEFARVAAVNPDGLALQGPLRSSYTVEGSARAQVLRVPNYLDLTVPAGTSLSAWPWDGHYGGILVFRALGEVRVQGVIDLSGAGFRGVARSSTNNHPGYQGEGTSGSWSYTRTPNGNGGGGGERNGCECCWGGAGGGGGHATSGSNGSNGGNACQLGGLGGSAVGDSAQSLVFFGGAGGQGGADEDGYGSAGAAGGGILYLSAASLVLDGGSIDASGVGGAGEYNFAGCGSGGGGGGAGGALFFEVDRALLGDSRLFAIGGAGGNTAGNCGTPGGAGAEGRVTVKGALSIEGSSTPSWVSVP